MAFDPDKYLAETQPAQKTQPVFDPDKYLAETEAPSINTEREASLGFINRARYAVEPIQSNRIALLQREFGPENVMSNEEGDIFLREGNQYRPVNREGFSVADVADVAGATPEILGSTLGTIAGAAGGGGALSVPAAIGFGALGGGVGSEIRQGVSAILGTPQVATDKERLIESGTSAAFGAAGAGLGIIAKETFKKVAPIVRKIFPSFGTSKEGLKLARIAAKEGLPAPTKGQLIGGRDLDLEKVLANRPLFGTAIRKQTEAQVDAIKTNLTKVAGDFMDVETPLGAVGDKVVGFADNLIKQTKSTASSMFDDVANAGKDIVIPRKQFKGELLAEFQRAGLFDFRGNPLKHSSKTGLTADQFNRVQNIFGTILRDIDASGIDIDPGMIKPGQLGKYVDVTAINTMRKFIDANIKEGQKQGFDDVVLTKLRDSFLDATESILKGSDPKLEQQFKQARSLWSKQLEMKTISKKLGLDPSDLKGLSEEKVVDRIMGSAQNVRLLRKVADEKIVNDVGTSYVNNLLSRRLGKEGQISAAGALSTVKKNKEAIAEAIGKEKYNKLANNLFYLDKVGSPINPSRTAITEMMSDVLDPRKLASGALQWSQREMRTMARSAVIGSNRAAKKLPSQFAAAANLLGDETQRGLSEKALPPSKRAWNK